VLGPVSGKVDLAYADTIFDAGSLALGGRSSLSGAGDVNADGADDVLIGAPWSAPSSTKATEPGGAFLVYGAGL